MTDLTTDAIKQPTCRKCGGTMQPGHALGQTYTSGAPDDLGGDAQTMSTNEMPERIWLDVESYNGAVGFAHAKRKDEGQWQEFVRSDLCASGPQVRALEWGAEVKFSGQPAFYSDSEFGIGMIVDHSVHGNGIKAYDEMGDSIGVFPDFDAAKAAAQAEYERRILAALTPAPQPEVATPTAQEAVLTEGELDEAWKSGFNAGFGEAKLTTHQPQPSVSVAVAAEVLLGDLAAIKTLVDFQLRHSASASDKARSMRHVQMVAALQALKGGDV